MLYTGKDNKGPISPLRDSADEDTCNCVYGHFFDDTQIKTWENLDNTTAVF